MTKDLAAQLTSMPGYRLHEYMLVLHPHEELWNKIANLKKEFAQQYEAPSAGWGKPQIVVARFSQLQLMEERVVNRLKMVAMAMPAFKLELRDYGVLPTHTIFINIETQVPLQKLAMSLKGAQQLLRTKEQKPYFIENPHIVLASKLLPWQFEKGWLEYSHRRFTGRFVAKSMLLLSRPAGLKSFKPIEKFEFMNMPVETRQGQLFVW